MRQSLPPNDLTEANGIIFSSRMIVAQFKAFIDSKGGLWSTQGFIYLILCLSKISQFLNMI